MNRYDYFYLDKPIHFLFFRLPQMLVDGKHFKNLSSAEKLLYCILLDKVSLSQRNGWSDRDGRVYINYKMEEAEKALGCSHASAVRYFGKLEYEGLIKVERIGHWHANKIYVLDCNTIIAANERKEGGSK